ncbi:GerMN domain-containing protein [Peribacillus simplex]|uniref:GerMN domain-containing protein n=1 Tax=Peribacillus simplex TaxID=1478 RepID=UPI0011DC892B|nr:GerMN domain-containing protein [Peribacillus simplex]
MRRTRWKENEIEDMLRELPKLKDDRTKAEVFARIHENKRKKHWIPLIAGVASLFLMVVLASSIIIDKKGTTSQEGSGSSGKLSISENKEMADLEQQDASNKENPSEDKQYNQEFSSKQAEIESKDKVSEMEPRKRGKEKTFAQAIYQDDLKNASIITMGVPDDQMNFIVPISIKLKHYDESDTLNQLVNQMSEIDEEQYGLSDYFPLDIKISQGNDMTTANIDFQEKSQLLDEDTLFLHSMEETLSYTNIEKMTFSTGGKQGAMFAHAGYLKGEDIPHQKNRTYLLYQRDKTSPRFLVPSNMGYQDFEEALQAGKGEADIEGISPAIPHDLKWERISSDGDLVIIQLSDQAAIENNEESLQALEAILFIAKDFGFEKVKFENAPIEEVGQLNLTEDILVPKAPNQVN